jgi:hypothetical protein
VIASRLTMRAAVERNQTATKDAWGQPDAAAFVSTGDPLPCFVWSEDTRELIDGQKTALIGDFRALFALGADIQADDQVAGVTDRQGNELIGARLQVRGKPERKHTHLEVTLKRIG